MSDTIFEQKQEQKNNVSMPHRFLDSGITDIILSFMGYGFAVIIGWAQYTGDVAQEIVEKMPDWYAWTLVGLVILSTAFMNVSKGIRHLRGKNKDDVNKDKKDQNH